MGRFRHIIEAFEGTPFTLAEVAAPDVAGENDWKRFLGAYDTLRALDAASVEQSHAPEGSGALGSGALGSGALGSGALGAVGVPSTETGRDAGVETEAGSGQDTARAELGASESEASCAVCGKGCKSNAGLAAHMRHTHGKAKGSVSKVDSSGAFKPVVRAAKVHIHDGYTRPLTPPEMAGREI